MSQHRSGGAAAIWARNAGSTTIDARRVRAVASSWPVPADPDQWPSLVIESVSLTPANPPVRVIAIGGRDRAGGGAGLPAAQPPNARLLAATSSRTSRFTPSLLTGVR